MIHPFSKRLSDGKIRHEAHFEEHEPPDESQSDEQPNKINVQRYWFSKHADVWSTQQDIQCSKMFNVKS